MLVVGLTATPSGCTPTFMVPVTLLAEPEITDNVPEFELVTYKVFVRVFTAMPLGWLPTPIVAVTVLVDPEITRTVPSSWLAT
jgi:hypothetical protein